MERGVGGETMVAFVSGCSLCDRELEVVGAGPEEDASKRACGTWNKGVGGDRGVYARLLFAQHTENSLRSTWQTCPPIGNVEPDVCGVVTVFRVRGEILTVGVGL